MTQLDDAMKEADANADARPAYYELVLQTQFFIPTHEEKSEESAEAEAKEGEESTEPSPNSVFPLIAESEGTDFLVMFDTRERLFEWAQQEVPFVCLPGHIVVDMTTEDLHWAVNAGTETQRVFVPDEITWLKKVVNQCKEIEDIQNAQEGESSAPGEDPEEDAQNSSEEKSE